jgi:hypothetical protein
MSLDAVLSGVALEHTNQNQELAKVYAKVLAFSTAACRCAVDHFSIEHMSSRQLRNKLCALPAAI